MRRHHLESLRPQCPVCRSRRGLAHALTLVAVEREQDEQVLEGMLRCPNTECQREYPIIDGIPLLVVDIRSYVSGNLSQIHARDDLSPLIESVIGDCCGPSSGFDITRIQISSYAYDHWGDLDPGAPVTGSPPGAVRRVLERALALAGALPEGPVLDLGCSAGRSTLDLAAGTGRMAVGVDLAYAALRVAQGALRGRVSYPLRRVGLVYDQRVFAVAPPAVELVDFWACDGAAMPFADGVFAAAVGLNVIDSAEAPHGLLTEAARVLRPGGRLVLAAPYDWAAHATPVEEWIGGHSQRGEDGGQSASVLRRLLTPGAHPASVEGLRIVDEDPSVPWQVRSHDRAVVGYDLDMIVAERVGASG